MPKLTQSDLEAYRHQGYLLLREGFQQEDLLPIRALISELIEEHAQKLYRAGKLSTLYETESFERRLDLVNEEAKPKFPRRPPRNGKDGNKAPPAVKEPPKAKG